MAVLYFEGKSVSGSIVADEFIRQLIYSGVDVVERQHMERLMEERHIRASTATSEQIQETAHLLGVDAFFTGTVSLYQPDQRFLVTLTDEDNLVEQPVIEMKGSKYYQKDQHVDDDAYVLSVGAVVSVSARLIDARTGSVVWADNATYEALQASDAVASIISNFLHSLKPYSKALKKTG